MAESAIKDQEDNASTSKAVANEFMECADFEMEISESQEAPKMIDKSVQISVKTANKRTQYDPMIVSPTQEIGKPEILKVKISGKKQRTSECNTDISFPPTVNVVFSIAK